MSDRLIFKVVSKKIKKRKFPHMEIKIAVKDGKKEMGTITIGLGILGALTLKNI